MGSGGARGEARAIEALCPRQHTRNLHHPESLVPAGALSFREPPAESIFLGSLQAIVGEVDCGGVAELVDAADLKSAGQQWP